MSKVILVLLWILRPILRRWRKAELAAAICVAGLYDLRTKWDGLRAALRSEADPEISRHVAEDRLELCQSCNIFDPVLQTCGSAIKNYGKPPAEQVGCECHVPTAVQVAHNCWLYDRGTLTDLEPSGWPARLNSFPLPNL